jgi:hypothetical protein
VSSQHRAAGADAALRVVRRAWMDAKPRQGSEGERDGASAGGDGLGAQETALDINLRAGMHLNVRRNATNGGFRRGLVSQPSTNLFAHTLACFPCLGPDTVRKLPLSVIHSFCKVATSLCTMLDHNLESRLTPTCAIQRERASSPAA